MQRLRLQTKSARKARNDKADIRERDMLGEHWESVLVPHRWQYVMAWVDQVEHSVFEELMARLVL